MVKGAAIATAALTLSACQKDDPPVPDPAPPPNTTASPVASAAASTSAARGGATPPAAHQARVWSFDTDTLGAAPPGFAFARTGAGNDPRYVVRAADDAPSKPNVLVQRDADATSNRFPVAVAEAVSFENVDLSVKCKAVSGKVDQACGLVWRYRDANNYYVTRSNALENNVRIYHIRDGKRVQFGSWSGKVSAGVWSLLRVEARGDHFVVSFDGRKVLDVKDSTFTGPGKVGVWTKADSVTEFDDLSVRPL